MALAEQATTHPDTDRRADFIVGLRALADFYDEHRDFPLPYNNGAHDFIVWCADADQFAQLVSTLGGSRDKSVDDNFFNVARSFGPIAIELYVRREEVCTKVETGKVRTVTVETLPAEIEAQIAALRAEHTVTKTIDEPEVVWECPPSVLDLDRRARGLAGVADLRTAAEEARAAELASEPF